MKRRTFKDIEAAARSDQRREDIAELCRVLKHHLGMPDAADALWAEMQRPSKKLQVHGLPPSPWAS